MFIDSFALSTVLLCILYLYTVDKKRATLFFTITPYILVDFFTLFVPMENSTLQRSYLTD